MLLFSCIYDIITIEQMFDFIRTDEGIQEDGIMGYQEFIGIMKSIVVEEPTVQILMNASGIAYESYTSLSEVYCEEDDGADDKIVLEFDDDSTLVITPGNVSIRESDECGNTKYSIEGPDLLIELSIL